MSPIADRSSSKPSPEMLVRRAFNYSLLAAALDDPDDEGVAALHDLVETGGELAWGTSLAGLAAMAATADSDTLQPEFTLLFSLSSSPDCPTFESAFACSQPAEQTSLMADVAGFYRAFGVDPAGQGLRPDDIRVELEFMAFLCRKQLYAVEHLGAPRVAQVNRAMRMFIGEHLGRWAPGLGRSITAHANGSTFYTAVGMGLTLWLEEECQRLKVTPTNRYDAPAMPMDRPQPEPEDLATADLEAPIISLDDIEVI